MFTCNHLLKSFLALISASFVFGCGAEQAKPGPVPTPPPQSPPSIPPQSPPSTPPPLAAATKIGEPAKRLSGLVYETLKEGTGPQSKSGDTATIHYTAAVEGGKDFDSTRDRNQPATFELGDSRFIQGWNEGITGMTVGERRKLTIPPNLAYGALGRLPVIPPNSTIILDIELLAIGAPPPDLKAQSLGLKFTLPSSADMYGGRNEWLDKPAAEKKK